MEDTLFRGNREPTLDQILAEPIIQTMMRCDEIDERTIREVMRKAASAKPPSPPKLDFAPPASPEVGESPQMRIGALARIAAEPHWPRVFPSL